MENWSVAERRWNWRKNLTSSSMKFSKGDCFREGFGKFIENPTYFLAITILPVALCYSLYYFRDEVSALGLPAAYLVIFLLLSFLLIYFVGYLEALLKIDKEGKMTVFKFLKNYKELPEFVWRFFFYFLIIGISFIFLVIPSIFLAVRFSFFPMAALKGFGIKDSFGKSWEYTKGHFFDLLLIYLGLIIITIPLVYIHGLFLIFSIPLSGLVIVSGYQSLREEKERSEIKKVPHF